MNFQTLQIFKLQAKVLYKITIQVYRGRVQSKTVDAAGVATATLNG